MRQLPEKFRLIERGSNAGPSRRGFTLLELLIVVSIIALLMSLSFVAMTGLSDQAEEDATVTTVQKINRLLEQRVEAFDRAFKGARKQNAISGTRTLLASNNIFGVREEVVEILAKKASFRFEFPQRMIERIASGDTDTLITGVPDTVFRLVMVPRVRQELVSEGIPNPTNAQILTRATVKWNGGVDGTKTFPGNSPNTESIELLYFALIASGNFGSSPVDGDRFNADELTDSDQDGLPEFVDFWGNPLRFYRWPTRLMDTNPPVPFSPDLSDPNDPTDVLVVDGATVVGVREVTALERDVANMLVKGLPPAPSLLPNSALPRDLMLTDPDDPVGRLYSELERLNGVNGAPNFSLEFNEAQYHTPDTYHSPIVVSAGKDGVLGLFEPNDTANFGNLAAYDSTVSFDEMLNRISDNITNRNRRAGGRRR